MFPDLSASPHARLRPLPAEPLPPFWDERVRRNRTAGIPRLFERLSDHGVVANFEPAQRASRRGLWFTDSDLYKWMEAAAWAGDVAELEPTVAVVLGAQQADGYLNTNFGGEGQIGRFHDLTWSHELYCAGHFVQAAVARRRVQGRTDLLDAAERLADCIARELPPGARDHHPVIEMALVELYRATGRARHLDLAVDLADRVPWRSWDRLAGHAVCALYFASGLTDIALETGDAERVDAVRRWHHDLVSTSLYLTGAVGGRWVAEAMGERYEMPQARSYTETCAAVAAIQWHHRMLALTGEPAAAQWLSTTLHNAFLAGVSAAGDEWFYATPHATTCSHEAHPWIGDAMPAEIAGPLPLRRAPWRDVTCCPPNATRMLASLPGYVAMVGDDGRRHRLLGEPRDDAEPRWVRAHHRVESLRGAVALRRDPFVYCFEGIDQPDGVGGPDVPSDLRDIAVDVTAPLVVGRDDDLAGGVPTIEVEGRVRTADALYDPHVTDRHVRLRAIPFHAFANRGETPMIMWVPPAPDGTATG